MSILGSQNCWCSYSFCVKSCRMSLFLIFNCSLLSAIAKWKRYTNTWKKNSFWHFKNAIFCQFLKDNEYHTFYILCSGGKYKLLQYWLPFRLNTQFYNSVNITLILCFRTTPEITVYESNYVSAFILLRTLSLVFFIWSHKRWTKLILFYKVYAICRCVGDAWCQI